MNYQNHLGIVALSDVRGLTGSGAAWFGSRWRRTGGVEGWRGIYSLQKIQLLHTFDPTRSDQIEELGETNSVQNVNVRNLGGTDLLFR